MTVRLVREEEWELARDARLGALAESPAAFQMTLPEEEHSSEEEWRERVRPTDRRAWFAEAAEDRFDGIVVVAIAEPDPRLAWIFSMWVDPALRRRGVGRRLVEAALEWAAERGAARVELEVSEQMEAARGLYSACGFVPTGTTRELPAHANATAIRMAYDIEGKKRDNLATKETMQATIKEKREVAKGTLFVTFDLGGQDVDFEPGQYFWVELLDPPYDDEKGARRHITVATSPTEKGVLGLATRIRDTAFKRSLAEMPEGAAVDVEQPKGSFLLPEDTSKIYVFLAGGIGITPFRSMLRYIADKGLDDYKITLVYSNRDRDSAAFFDELKELDGGLSGFRAVFTMDEDPSWDGETRRISPEMLEDVLGDDLNSFHFMIAGPPGMAKAVEAAILEAGVPEDQVQSDSFSGY